MICDWVPLLTSLMTPLIAGIAIYVAWQQWRTNRQKLKLDLFDKRFAIFQSTRTFLSTVLRDGRVNREDLEKFRMGILDSVFLLDQGTSDYLWGLRSIGSKAIMYNTQLEGVPVGEKRNELVDNEHREVEKLMDALGDLQEKFKPFLKLDH